jgi:hypothetical protein
MNLLPRVLTDPVKGYQEYTQGVTTQKGKVISSPQTAYDAFLKSIGLTTIDETHVREARAAVGEERQGMTTELDRIKKMWADGDKGKALTAAQKFNQTYPGQHITPKSLQTSMKPTLLGYPESNRNRKDLEDHAAAYGITQ